MKNDKRPGSKNHHFIQLSKTYMDDYAKLIQKQPAAASLLMFLSARMGKTNNAIIVSYKTMMDLTGYSRPTIAAAIKTLREQSWIDSVRIGNVKAYAINEKFLWQSGNDQRQYAEFSATCIAAKDEQDKSTRRHPAEKLRFVPNCVAV